MKRLTAITILLGLAAPALAQNSISLRPAARVEAGRPVLLGQVAVLGGEGAEGLATIEVLATAPAGGGTISTDELRRLLAPAKLSWGSTTLSGSACRLIVAEVAAAAAPAARHEPSESSSVLPDSIGEALAARIGAMVDAAPEDLRLDFAEGDRDLLDTAVAGRALEVRTVGASERMALAVTLYEGDRIAVSKSIRVGVLIRRDVCTAVGARRRGEILGDSDVTTERRWLSPAARPAPRGRVVGAAVRGRLLPGELITEQHLAPPVIVQKGDQVMVRCLAGSVVVTMRARALGDAREGETVPLESLDRPGSTFEARMDGRGRAVLLSARPPRAR